MREAVFAGRGRWSLVVAMSTIIVVAMAGVIGLRFLGSNNPNNRLLAVGMPNNTVSFATFSKSHPEIAAKATKSNSPTLIVLSAEPMPRDSLMDFDVVLANPLDVPIVYSGHAPDLGAAGRINPMWTVGIRKDEGWIRTCVLCGNEVHEMRVGPREVGTFRASAFPKWERIKFTLSYSWIDHQGTENRGVAETDELVLKRE
jgi:hypothetical protein